MGDQRMLSSGGNPWQLGEGCRSEVGVSLPPRKRLLAGLKQNGWLSFPCGGVSSSVVEARQSSAASPISEVKLEVDIEGAKVIVEAGKSDAQEECASNRERSKNEEDGNDTSDDDKERDRHDTECDTDTECPTSSSPKCDLRDRFEEKLPMDVESLGHRQESDYGETMFGDKAMSAPDSSTQAFGSKRKAISPHKMVAAAKLTAAMAAKTAAEAKATAAEKAAVAAKAAAVARAALDAVAVAARAEVRNSEKNSVRGHSRGGFGTNKDKKMELKAQREDSDVSQVPSPVNDEELARQLHRAINSSPRISRSQMPLKRNHSTSFLELKSAAGCVKPSLLMGTPTSQGKHQSAQPRSSSFREGKIQDTKARKRNSKRSVEMEPQRICEPNNSTSRDVAGTYNSSQRIGSLELDPAGDRTTENATSQQSYENGYSVKEGSALKLSGEGNLNKDYSVDSRSDSFPLLSTQEMIDLDTNLSRGRSIGRRIEIGSSGFFKGANIEDIEQDSSLEVKEEICKGKVVYEDGMVRLEQNNTAGGNFSESLEVTFEGDGGDLKKESDITTVTIEEPSLTNPMVDEHGKHAGGEWNSPESHNADFPQSLVVMETSMKGQQKLRGSARNGKILQEENLMHIIPESKGSSSIEKTIGKSRRPQIKQKPADRKSKSGLSHSINVSAGTATLGSALPMTLRTSTVASGSTGCITHD